MEEKTIVFTILAKNYLALAKTLGDSLKEYNSHIDFLIILADEVEDRSIIDECKHTILEAKNLDIENFNDLAFKFDLSELSTTIKPIGFEYCFEKLGCDKVYYFDPDIKIYDSLNSLDEYFSDNTFLLTPHFINLENEWSGAVPENNFLVSGVFNLGFIGIKKAPESMEFVTWWKNKLFQKGYIERSEGLFYDQNWTQFLLTSYPEEVKVIQHFGMNIAWWNLHERSLVIKNKKYYVVNNKTNEDFPLIFFHFSGYDIGNERSFNRRYSKNPFFSLDSDNNLKNLFISYSDNVKNNFHEKYKILKYKYNFFDNDVPILKLYRRIYRQLILKNVENQNLDSVQRKIQEELVSMKKSFGSPFFTGNNSFYKYLKNSNLIIKDKSNQIDSINPDRDSSRFENKVLLFLKLLRFLKKIIGIKNYTLILKFLSVYTRNEYQTFLLKDVELKINKRK